MSIKKTNLIKLIIIPMAILLCMFLLIAYKYSFALTVSDYVSMGIVMFTVFCAGFYMMKRKNNGKSSCGGCCTSCPHACGGCDKNDNK